ncbi:MAG: Rieske 2Fe-2S domain-containing protein [Acidimicrobiales bacterium]
MTSARTRPPAAPRSVWARRLHQPGWVVLPLRAFLGFTFVYAGIQKLADRSFFDSASAVGIQRQLDGVVGSPIQPVVAFAAHHAFLFGLAIALGELAVGLGALLGLWTRVAAVGGALISLGFLLTVSWQTDPFYYSPDLVFLVAWLPLVLVGDGGVLSVDAWLRSQSARALHVAPAGIVPIEFSTVRSFCGAYDKGFCTLRRSACGADACPVLEQGSDVPARAADEVDRRAFLAQAKVAGAMAVGAIVVGASGAVVGRLIGGSAHASSTDLSAGGALDDGSTSPTTADAAAPTTVAGAAAPTTPTTTGATGAVPAGKAIGAASKVPVGGSATFTDPKSLDPGIVVQPTSGTFMAFDASCTHEGCPVAYSKSSNCLVCPCHGARFDASTGAVLRGPARRPLAKITVAQGPDGKLYVGG